MSDNKNVVLAVVLSIVVMLGWNYFYLGPKVEAERALQEAQQAAEAERRTDQPTAERQGTGPGAPTVGDQGATTASPSGIPAPGAVAPTPATGADDAATAPAQRVPIRTGRVEGSINLVGGRIDDLRLVRYRQTVEPDSPTVRLLAPSGSPDPYYAEFGWAAESGAGMPVPDRNTVWSAPSNATLTVGKPLVLTWDNGAGLVFKRRFEIDDAYMFSVTQSVENTTEQDVGLFPYGLISRHGTPPTEGFYILHEGLIGVVGDELKEVDYDDLDDSPTLTYDNTNTGWVGITDKYWGTALVPPAGTGFVPRFSSGKTGDKRTYQADYLSDVVTIPAKGSAEVTSRLFAGAKEVKIVDGYEAQYGIKSFELMIDWGWLYFITKPMFYAIDWLYGIFGNFGLAILAVTVGVKLLFFPLANKSYKSMSMMKKVQPQIMELRERFKDDKQKQQQAMMELYKKEKINPLSGCLPIVVQIPVFFALYKVLFVTIDMRHAPFFGWIRDLSAPDPTTLFNLFGLIPWMPPEWVPLLGVWPLIMGVTMFIQMKMNPAPTDATQAMIFNWMPVLFTFMLASFPAGLVIYWAWNNFLSILQQGVIMRRYGVKIELFDNIRGMFSKGEKPAE